MLLFFSPGDACGGLVGEATCDAGESAGSASREFGLGDEEVIFQVFREKAENRVRTALNVHRPRRGDRRTVN